ncbi:hypothetical protein [Streptosporangium roseum]|uniref:hypothetical protein n=1 Tax=Streptosporangium roseum TaxID=2001 RepID=UPI00055CFA0F|nr:hypothetical protein [Streptosporangium roseum]
MTAFADHGTHGAGEPLALILRPGNAGSNTATDHINATILALAHLKPHILGAANIDHVMLTGGSWLIIDAKGCGDRYLGLSSERAGQQLEGR